MQSAPTLPQIKDSLKNAPKKKTIMRKSEPKTFNLELTAAELRVLNEVHVDYINDGDMEELGYGKRKINTYDKISEKIIALVEQAKLQK